MPLSKEKKVSYAEKMKVTLLGFGRYLQFTIVQTMVKLTKNQILAGTSRDIHESVRRGGRQRWISADEPDPQTDAWCRRDSHGQEHFDEKSIEGLPHRQPRALLRQH